MAKRSGFALKNDRGFYPTPCQSHPQIMARLLPFLPQHATQWWEPCAGDGALFRALAAAWPAGECVLATDIEPLAGGIFRGSLFDHRPKVELIITNPAWPRIGGKGEPVISTIKHLTSIAPTWLLLSWDFAANDYFGRVAAQCTHIVPIGRVSWEDNGTPGKDNCAWYCFVPEAMAIHGKPFVYAR